MASPGNFFPHGTHRTRVAAPAGKRNALSVRSSLSAGSQPVKMHPVKDAPCDPASRKAAAGVDYVPAYGLAGLCGGTDTCTPVIRKNLRSRNFVIFSAN